MRVLIESVAGKTGSLSGLDGSERAPELFGLLQGIRKNK